MERRCVVNRHVAPRTTVSPFREVSEEAGNAGLRRAAWTCTYAPAGLEGRIDQEINDDDRSIKGTGWRVPAPLLLVSKKLLGSTSILYLKEVEQRPR